MANKNSFHISDSNQSKSGEMTPVTKKNLFRRTLKVFAYGILVFSVLLILLVALLQTTFFKNWLLSIALNKINKELLTKECYIDVGSIEGNLITHLRLNSINIIVKRDTLLKIDTLDLQYSLKHIFKRKLTVDAVSLLAPRVFFTKVYDRKGNQLWNYDLLLKTETIDTTKKEFDWDINVDRIFITSGEFYMVANKQENKDRTDIKFPILKTFSTELLSLVNIHLDAGGRYSLNDKELNLKHLTFSSNSPIDVKNLSLTAKLIKGENTEVSDLELQTQKGNVTIKRATLYNLDLSTEEFDYENLGNKNVYVNLSLDKFDFSQLVFFLPELGFIRGTYSLNLLAEGLYSDLSVRNLLINGGKTELNIAGKVKNLNNPSKLFLDVSLRNSILNSEDTKVLLPGLMLPDLSYLGRVKADIKFTGEPQNFQSQFDISTEAGDIKGSGRLNITGKYPVYQAEVETRNVNLGSILKDKKFQSRINSKFMVEGTGFDIYSMKTSCIYTVTNSEIYGQQIMASSGKIENNGGVINCDINYQSNSFATKVKGEIDFKNKENLKYNLIGECQRLDVSTITGKITDKSNLNFLFEVNGTGIGIDNLRGNYSFRFEPSHYRDYFVPRSFVTAYFEQEQGSRKIKINSTFLDFFAEGKFTLTSLGDVIIHNFNYIVEDINKRFISDSIISVSSLAYNSTNKGYIVSEEAIDFRYNLKISDFRPINLILRDSTFLFKADVEGKVVNAKNDFAFTLKGKLSDFNYRDSNFVFKDASVGLSVSRKFKTDTILGYNVNGNFNLSTFGIKGDKFDTISVNIALSEEMGRFYVLGRKDTNLTLNVLGNLKLEERNLVFSFDRFKFRFQNYSFMNPEPLSITARYIDSLNTRVISFDNFKLTELRQKLEITGYYAFNNNSELSINADRLTVAKLQSLYSPFIDEDNLISGNIRRLRLKFDGTLQNPHLYLEMNTDLLSMQKIKLGRLDAIIDYKNELVKPEISFYNPNSEGKLAILGEMPVRNFLNQDNEGVSDSFLDNNINLQVKADNFQIKILEQFLPIISFLQGNLFGDIEMKGKVRKPYLSGKMNIPKGSFVLDMTGMKYNFNANFGTEEQKLLIEQMNLTAPGEEEYKGVLYGYIDLSNLKLTDLDIEIAGSFKILDKLVSKNLINIYGDLYGKTGSQPLKIRGNSSGLDMSGNITITEGKVYIPPYEKEVYNIYFDNFKYKTVFDSLSINKDSIAFITNRLRDSVKFMEKRRIDPFDFYFYPKSGEEGTAQRASIFHYKIGVQTERKLFVNLVIDEKTGQEFYGNVMANLIFDNYENDSLRVRGRVDLEDNCYYRFYKNFKASGYILFNGPLINPELFIDGNYTTTISDPNDSRYSREVEVSLKVREQTLKPKLTWAVYVNGNSVGGSDPTDEALSFIIFGRLKEELSAEQRINLFSNVGVNVGTSILSQYLTNTLQSYVPFLLSADINYQGSSNGNLVTDTDIRLTAEIGGATIRFGGQVFRDISNTNFTIEYPLNRIFKLPLTNNLVVQFERIINPYSETRGFSTSSRTGGLLFYRIKF
ncbi:MAG: hypothetical protein ACP5P3_08100 [Ignavibacteria bacterium]